MKVSILIPMYNAENFIVETINSVLNQTYQNIELIIIDDHSTDESFNIVENIKSSKIRLAKNTLKGACEARNMAFQLCTGDYIQYLDADDIIDCKKIETQMNLFKKYGDEMLVFGSWGRFTDSIEDTIWENNLTNKDYSTPINLLIDCWNNEKMIPIHSWLIPKRIIKNTGEWNSNLSHNQDGEFFSRVICNVQGLKFCKESKVYYRSNLSNSISSSSSSIKNASSQLLSYQLYIKNLKEHISNIELKKALANNFLNFIYRFHHKYPTLIEIAENEFHNLEVGKVWPVGGNKFKLLSRLIGFKTALNIKKILS